MNITDVGFLVVGITTILSLVTHALSGDVQTALIVLGWALVVVGIVLRHVRV